MKLSKESLQRMIDQMAAAEKQFPKTEVRYDTDANEISITYSLPEDFPHKNKAGFSELVD